MGEVIADPKGSMKLDTAVHQRCSAVLFDSDDTNSEILQAPFEPHRVGYVPSPAVASSFVAGPFGSYLGFSLGG